MSTLPPSDELREAMKTNTFDDLVMIRFLGPGDCIVCGDPMHVEKAITFTKGQAITVTRAVAEWALGMNASRQAEVFELVEDGGEG